MNGLTFRPHAGCTDSNKVEFVYPGKQITYRTWGKRAGLKLSYHITQLSLQISSIGVLQSNQHALYVHHSIPLRIKLTKGLRQWRRTKTLLYQHLLPHFHSVAKIYKNISLKTQMAEQLVLT